MYCNELYICIDVPSSTIYGHVIKYLATIVSIVLPYIVYSCKECQHYCNLGHITLHINIIGEDPDFTKTRSSFCY